MPSRQTSANGDVGGGVAADVAMLCSACASTSGCHSIGTASADGICARMSSHDSCIGSDSDEALLLLLLLLAPQSSECHDSHAFTWPGRCAGIVGSPLTPADAFASSVRTLTIAMHSILDVRIDGICSAAEGTLRTLTRLRIELVL